MPTAKTARNGGDVFQKCNTMTVIIEPGCDKTGIWGENMKISFSLQTVFRYQNFNCTQFHDDLSFMMI